MVKRKLVWLALLIMAAIFIAGCANKYKTSGKIAMGSKNWDKAVSDFQKALEQTPNDGEIHYLMALIYKEKGEYKNMIPHLNAADTLYTKGEKKVAELREGTWKELFDAGNNDTKSENYEKATDEFQTAIAFEPKNYAAYTNAGYVWQKRQNGDSAYYYFSEAYRIEPQNIKVIENLASLSFNQKKYPQADSLYAMILEKDPKHSEAMIRRGMIAGINGNNEVAVNFYNSALQLEPDNCDLWFNLGLLYFQQIKNDEEALKKDSLRDEALKEEALKSFTRAVELCPEDVEAHINLNVTLMTLQRFDEAMQNLETFTQDFPNECVGWDLYSQALLRKGLKSQALEAADKYEECKKSSQ